MVNRHMKPSEFTDGIDDNQVAEAIRQAEANTSGEIRVFISQLATEDPVAAARREFGRLGMHRTPMRNGVLLFFAPVSNQFAVYGDEGIHLRCGEDFWKSTTEEMQGLLRSGRMSEAIAVGIRRVGEVLSQHFPKYPGDRDDLPNTVARD